MAAGVLAGPTAMWDNKLNGTLRSSTQTENMMVAMRQYLLAKQNDIVVKSEQLREELATIEELERALEVQVRVQAERAQEIIE